MKYEYVALTWTTDCPCADDGFALTYQRWVQEGWTEVRRASYPAANYGGACVMRRPKDEPELKLEPVYEYVAVLGEDEAKGQWDALKRRGWVQTRCVRLSGRLGHIHLMRRIDPAMVIAEAESKDEPRMWTETELRGLAQHIAGTLTLWQLHASQWTETQLVNTILGAIQEVLIVPASESLVCSEPRMWTEAEIQEIAKGVLAAHVNLSAM